MRHSRFTLTTLSLLIFCSLTSQCLLAAAKAPETPEERVKATEMADQKRRLQDQFTKNRVEQKERVMRQSLALDTKLNSLKAPHPEQHKFATTAPVATIAPPSKSWPHIYWALALLVFFFGSGYIIYQKLKTAVRIT